MLLFLTTPIIDLKAQKQVGIQLSERYILYKYGGNLVCQIEIKVTDRVDILEIRYPNYIPQKIVGLRAVYNGILIPVEIKKTDTDTIITLRDLRDIVEPGEAIEISYIVPLAVKTIDGRIYNVTIPYAPILNYNLTRLNITIDLPLGVEPTTTPKDMIKKMMKIEKGEQQFQLYAKLAGEKARSKQGVLINLRLRSKEEGAIQIMIVNIIRNVHVNPDLTYSVEDIIKLKNLCGTTLEKGTTIVFNKTDSISEIEAYSSVKQPLKLNIEKQAVEVRIPYTLKQNETLTVILKYNVNPDREIQGSILSMRAMIPVKDFIYMTYYMENVMINIISPMNQTPIVRVLTDQIGRINEDVAVVIVETTPYVITRHIAPILYIIVIIGVVMTIVKAPKVKQLLNEDVKAFVGMIREEVQILEKVIELEERYGERRIRMKEYIQQTKQLNQKLKSIQQKVEKKEEAVRKKVSGIVEIRRKMMETLNQLRKLQLQLQQRKITPKEYTERKQQIVRQLKVYIVKLKIWID